MKTFYIKNILTGEIFPVERKKESRIPKKIRLNENFSRASDEEVKNYLVERLKSKIKKQASQLILNSYPEWKQRNHMAVVLEIQNKELMALKLGTPYLVTEDEIASLNSALEAKNKVFLIREKSDLIELSLNTKTLSELESFDPTNNLNWL